MKTKRIVAPMTEKDHDEVVAYVKKKGFDSVAAYVRMLIRYDMSRDQDVGAKFKGSREGME